MPRLKVSERPNPTDDARERRILTDDELTRVLGACGERTRLLFRTLAESGARKSDVFGLTPRRIGTDTITFDEQLDDTGEPVPGRPDRRGGRSR